MSARAELEAKARAGFRAVMLSNHTAEKFASESSARELRFLCSVFDEECSWREKSKRERLLKRARFPVPIMLAICINVMRNKRFKKASQMIVYIPHFISVVVLVLTKWILNFL